MIKFSLILFILILPAFSSMLRPGVWTMHDFHLFRQYEFDRCIAEGVFPCRWTPDAGLGYGQPMFNYYTQFPYWIGEIFHLFGFSIISSVKLLFILSLVLSGLSMFFLARTYWGNVGGLISSLFYILAPYRAVDVWVRGALPEALAFVYFPVILLALDKKKYLLFSLFLALLLITHNLSLFMFLPFLCLWWLFKSRDWKFIPASVLSLFLSAYYLLPVIFENRLVTLSETTRGYYQYAHHFASLKQLFVSTFWGYGGSVWGPNDSMSFSAGHLHWTVAVLVGFFFVLHRYQPYAKRYLLFTGLALLALFLTHAKSDFLWKVVPGMPFIQFPWRFLSLSTLFLSLASGAVSKFSLPAKALATAGPALLLLLNANFFRPDIWRTVSDREQFSGALWDEQRSSALPDYWPKSAGPLPDKFASSVPRSDPGRILTTRMSKGSHRASYDINVLSPSAPVEFPTVNFPGWTALVDSVPTAISTSPQSGLISFILSSGTHRVDLEFTDTWPRAAGNYLSLAALAFYLLLSLRRVKT